MLWPGHFGYAAASGTGPDVTLSDVRFAIDQEAQMRLAARSLSARPVAGTAGQWDVEITALAPCGVTERALVAAGARRSFADGRNSSVVAQRRWSRRLSPVARSHGPWHVHREVRQAGCDQGDAAGRTWATSRRWSGGSARWRGSSPRRCPTAGSAWRSTGRAWTPWRTFFRTAATAHVHELTVHTTTGERQAVLKQVAHGD